MKSVGSTNHEKVFAITGAGSGLGLCLVDMLLKSGAVVSAADVTTDTVIGLQAEYGTDQLHLYNGDLTNSTQVSRFFRDTYSAFGRIDGVVSCVGEASTGLLSTVSDGSWHHCLGLNLTSHFFVLREALRLGKDCSNKASVVLIGSKTAVAPGLGFGAYAIAKAGVVQLARVGAIEGGQYGVRVNVINPGAFFEGSRFWTDEVRAERAHLNGIKPAELESFYSGRNLLKHVVRPDDIAEVALFLLSTSSSATTGCIISVDGGDEDAFTR
jgi:NAD(P)-dependent dehydrogenase (short-subunit alcohol dehydrogenase family)